MRLSLRVPRNADVTPPRRELLEAAARGVSDAVKQHLEAKDTATPPRGVMPKTGYYGDAA